MPADAFPPFDAPFGIFRWFELACQRSFYEKNRQLTMLLRPSAAPKKTTNWRPSVNVQLNSMCTDGRQFSDWLTSAAGDQLENRDNGGGGGDYQLVKKGPLFVWRLGVLGCFLVVFWVFAIPAIPARTKKRKKGRARKKNGGNKWTRPPRLDRSFLWYSTGK
jgi:hypothetical protein